MEVGIFTIGLVFNIVFDGLRWGRGKYITKKGHQARFFIRGIGFSLLAISLADLPASPTFETMALLPLMFGMSVVWWLTFDPGVNLVAGQKFFHLGRTSDFDKIFWIAAKGDYKRAIVSQYIVKLVALALAAFWNSPAVFDSYMNTVRELYFQSIW